MARPTTKIKTVLRRRIQVTKLGLRQLVKLEAELIDSFSQSELTQKRIKEELRSKGIHSGTVDEDLSRFSLSITEAINRSLEQLAVLLEYEQLFSENDQPYSRVSDSPWDAEEHEASLANEEKKAQLEKTVKTLQKLLKGFQGVIIKLQTRKLPLAPTTSSVNFIKNNKLPAPDNEEPKRVRLPLSMAEDLAYTLNLMDKEMAKILTISIRTYHRLKLNGLLNPVASERLTMLKELAIYGLEVFENQDSFNQWLRLPLQELSNQSPLNSLETVAGFNQVKTILSRIDYGVYS